MEQIVKSDHEFFEVLNAFPNLKERLLVLSFNLSDLKEGISIFDYFLEKSYSEDEIDIFVKKINTEINYFLKNGNFPQMNLKDESEVLDSIEIS